MATFKEALTTSLTNFAKSIAKTYPKTANIVDNLLSTDSTLPLSAKQGNVLQTQISTLNSNINNRHFIYISATDTKETFEINIGNNNIAIAVASREGVSPAVYIIYQIVDKAFYYKLHDESNLISLSSNSNLLNITLNLQWTVFRYFVI